MVSLRFDISFDLSPRWLSMESAPLPHDAAPPPSAKPRWQPLSSLDRRVLGVLVEKAKTTPDGYPMTINSIVTGANQKSNRYPLMEVEKEDVEASLDRLRGLGAVAIIQGGGRVDKYRHFIYEWLGVGKAEAAVMTELLLRGVQTEGELRGRAARMEPIADLAALRPILDSLKIKGLIVGLTPEGRGHVLTHALYEPRELEKLRGQYAGGGMPAHLRDDEQGHQTVTSPAPPPALTATRAAPFVPSPQPAVLVPNPAAAVAGAGTTEVADLRSEVKELRSQLAELRSELADLVAEFSHSREEMTRLRDALGG